MFVDVLQAIMAIGFVSIWLMVAHILLCVRRSRPRNAVGAPQGSTFLTR